jgi:hypothetical protein
MSREISLFTDYHQGENIISNYCGLMMKLIYEESPKNFEDFITTIIGSKEGLSIGPSFSQQVRKKESIPDLVISQKSFTVFVETKLTNWHYSGQIVRHLKSFNSNTDIKILILLADEYTQKLQVQFQNEISKATEDGIIIKAITCEELTGTMKPVCNSENLKKFLAEFELFLDNKKLMPKWKYLLDVVNCASSISEIKNCNVYICPEVGSSYSHRRAKYFGPYSGKKVESIYEIKGVVVTGVNAINNIVKWKNVSTPNKELIQEAVKNIKQLRPNYYKTKSFQVFLLKNGQPTNFSKDSSGGLYQSKKYFWDIAQECNSSTDLATILNNKFWSEFE